MIQAKPLLSLLLLALAGLSGIAYAQGAVAGNRDAGEKKIASCIGCHGIVGYQSSFPEVYRVPKISGQSEKYISSALTAYKKGDRRHPTMRAVAGSMSEQDIADVAAYYAQHGRDSVKPVTGTSIPAPSEAVGALLAKGACASCHGANFSQPIDPSYPKLAGQYPEYLYAALKSYQTVGNPQVGRNNGVMGGIAKPYSHAELRQLANYLGSIQGELRTVPQGKFR